MLFQTFLPIPGLATSKNVFVFNWYPKLGTLPEKLGILGGGNIGLEFAGLYNKLGSKVTVLDALDTSYLEQNLSIAALAKQYMERRRH